MNYGVLGWTRWNVESLERSYLRRNNHLIPHPTLLHPLTNPRLALFILVIIARVDEVATIIVEVIENLKGSILVAFTH